MVQETKPFVVALAEKPNDAGTKMLELKLYDNGQVKIKRGRAWGLYERTTQSVEDWCQAKEKAGWTVARYS